MAHPRSHAPQTHAGMDYSAGSLPGRTHADRGDGESTDDAQERPDKLHDKLPNEDQPRDAQQGPVRREVHDEHEGEDPDRDGRGPDHAAKQAAGFTRSAAPMAGPGTAPTSAAESLDLEHRGAARVPIHQHEAQLQAPQGVADRPIDEVGEAVVSTAPPRPSLFGLVTLSDLLTAVSVGIGGSLGLALAINIGLPLIGVVFSALVLGLVLAVPTVGAVAKRRQGRTHGGGMALAFLPILVFAGIVCASGWWFAISDAESAAAFEPGLWYGFLLGHGVAFLIAWPIFYGMYGKSLTPTEPPRDGRPPAL